MTNYVRNSRSGEYEEYETISVLRLAISVDQIDGHDKLSRHDR